MIVIFAGVSAIVPSLLLLWYFHRRDVNPEPAHVIWKTFGLGVLSVIPVLAVALPLAQVSKGLSQPYLKGAYDAFFTAAIPEEFFKLVVLWFYAARHEEFDEPMDGIVYGVTASLGFATLENVLYVGSGGLGVALLRAFTAVPGHALTGAIMGYYVGRARFAMEPAHEGHAGKERGTLPLAAFAVPVLLHGLYDFPLLTLKALQKASRGSSAEFAILAVGTLAVLITEWVWALRLTRRMRREQIALADAAATKTSGANTATQPAPPAATPAPHSGSPLEARPASRHRARGRGALGWFLLLLGGVLASLGGLMCLGTAISFATRDLGERDATSIVLGTLIIGVLPLVLGLWMFVRGLRHHR